MGMLALGFAAAVAVSILFPEVWGSIVEGGRKAIVIVERVRVRVERIKDERA